MTRTLLTKKYIALWFVLVLLLVFMLQPWSYNYHGFDEVTLPVAGGQIKFEIFDQVRKNKQAAYCLSSTFETTDKPGESVQIAIYNISTKTLPDLRGRTSNSGKTETFDRSGKYLSYFQPPSISKLVFPTEETLEVIGSIQYKGSTHPFHVSLHLRHWEKSREVIRFCV